MQNLRNVAKPLLLVSLSVAALVAANPAWAQDSQTTSSGTDQSTSPPAGAAVSNADASALEQPASAAAQPGAPSNENEIIVTAQRREERLNDVGISVVAATGDALLAKGVTTPADLVKVVPGLTAAETPYGTLVLTLRGVGFYESSLAGSSPVATYIDEIPLPYTRMAAGATLDLQRVEVLKGPQGTLFGQNSTGGAINFIANKPTDHFHAGVDASLGRFMDVDVQGYVSGPISSTLKARLALRTHQSDDWQKSVSRDDTMGATHMTEGRLLLDWTPTERLSFELNLNGFIDKSDTQAFAATGFFPNNPAAVQPAETAAVLTPPGSNRRADWDADKEFTRDNSFYQIALRTNYEISDSAEIIAISAYQHFKEDQFVDADGTNSETAESTQNGYIKSTSQEIRIQGHSERLQYTAGVNYSHDNIYDNTLFIVGEGSQAHGFPGLDFRIGRTFSIQKADTYAAFGNLDFEITDGLNLQGGIRYTKQNRDFVGCLGDPGAIGEGKWARLFSFLYNTTIPLGGCTTINPATGFIGLVTDKLNEDNVSWRAAVNYTPRKDALIYASVSRGYKSGSFSTVGGAISPQYIPATQESLLAYEVGTKVSLADRKLQVNAAVFYYDYSDKQFRGKIVDSIFGTIEKLYNVPKSSVKGAELQVFANPVRGLTLSGNLAYTDSKIKSDFPSLTPIGTPTNLKGQTFELTPKWAAGASATYDAPVTATLNGFIGVDYTYQSRTHGGYGGLPIFSIDAYSLIDLRAGVRDSDDKWRAQLWVRNLTDKYYWTNANYLGEFSYRVTGRPRTFGVTFGYKY
jgi:iron complex outermembrane receptor protein